MTVRRRLALAALAAVVALAHLGLAEELAGRLPSVAGDAPPPRLEVAFVRELAPAVPPPAARPARRPVPRPRPAPVAPVVADAASAPPASASAPEPDAAALPGDAASTVAAAAADAASAALDGAAAAPLAQAAEPAASAVPEALADATATAASPHLAWPPSTQLDYELSGWYRGEVHGSARVQWLHEGSRYQVHLEVVVGPRVAPLMTRRMSSDGELTAQGLAPRRYDEETRLAFMAPRRVTVRFEPEAVVLAGGRRLPLPPGVQDSASQFVQMTWLFTQEPARLAPGRVVELPLALPRRLDGWTYDVVEAERLDTPLGPVDAVHVKPRREAQAGEVMTAEAWFAPSLQYLPVRLRIHADAQTFVDLRLARAPLQAAAR